MPTTTKPALTASTGPEANLSTHVTKNIRTPTPIRSLNSLVVSAFVFIDIFTITFVMYTTETKHIVWYQSGVLRLLTLFDYRQMLSLQNLERNC